MRKATAGGTQAPAAPAPIVLPTTPVPASGVALPAAALAGAAPPAAPGHSRAELHAGAGFDPGARRALHAGALDAGHAAEQRRWQRQGPVLVG